MAMRQTEPEMAEVAGFAPVRRYTEKGVEQEFRYPAPS
jgi:hypothetical protein